MQNCPCGSTRSYEECCARFISGQALPATPEELMRSRFSAYHQHEFEYIKKTMLSPALDHFDINQLKLSADKIAWTRLEIISAEGNHVEFRAYYIADEEEYVLQEVSEFRQQNGKWYYVDGIYPDKPNA